MTAADLQASSEAQLSRAAAAARLERLLFWLCVAAAGALMWLAPRPAAIDLPQHAAQVALWRDLLKGTSPWSGLVFINLLTPYLIGYGAALPLSFVMPVEAAIALVLTVAFYAFVIACVALRKELKSDDRLDWLFLPSFFGFCWQWGFYTFLTAAPVLLLFLLAVLRYRREQSRGRGAALIGLGVALLFSHGLLFLFGLFASGLLLLGAWREPLHTRLVRLAPLVVLAALLLVFALVTHDRGTATQFRSVHFGTPIWLRPFTAIAGVNRDNWDVDPILAALTALALATPLFIGCRLNRGPAQILFAALAATYLFVPAYALQTGYLFPRFVLFLPPFLAFLCRRPDGASATAGAERPARLVMALACLAGLAALAWRTHAFALESESFVKVEQAAQPGRRALSLIFDTASPAASARKAYTHFPAYYQADRGGFVDFNFAVLPPQVVRFREGRKPAVTDEIVAKPATFDWQKDQAWIYDYFFMRGAPDALAWLQARSPCVLALAAADGPWSLVKRVSCPAPPPSGKN
jgi:hypothetical protein